LEITGEGELIHLGNLGKASHGKEENTASLGRWIVGISGNVDFLGGFFSDADGLGDFDGFIFGLF